MAAMEYTGINYYNVTRDFLPLTGFIIAYITYLFQRRNDKINKNEEVRSKQLNLIDTLIISLERIDTIFEGLKIDAKDKTYYSFANINLARPVVQRMQSVFSDVIVFSDDAVKEEILKNIDLLLPLIDDINSIEQLNTSENNKLNDASIKMSNDLQALKIMLFEHGVKLDDNNRPQFIDSNATTKQEKLDVAKSIVDSIKKSYENAEEAKRGIDRFIKDRRTFFAVQLVDVQTRLRELRTQLLTTRDSIQHTNKWTKTIKLFGFIKLYDSSTTTTE